MPGGHRFLTEHFNERGTPAKHGGVVAIPLLKVIRASLDLASIVADSPLS
jgi:hypothetical protein